MKKIALILLLIAGCVYSFTGCVYDKKEVANVNTCDTTSVSYSQTVAPIIATNCSQCHSTNATNFGAGGGIPLDTYSSLKSCADSSWLLPSINWQLNLIPASYNTLTGLPAENMPLALPILGTCDLNQVNAWVHQGAKNN